MLLSLAITSKPQGDQRKQIQAEERNQPPWPVYHSTAPQGTVMRA